jgi:hypothetical protein
MPKHRPRQQQPQHHGQLCPTHLQTGPPLHNGATAADTAPSETIAAPQVAPAEADRRSALTSFLQTPSLREPTNLYMGDIAFLLHLISDSTESTIAWARIIPPIPTPEAETILEAWSPHLAHEGVPAPYASTARNFFLGMLTSSPSNVG